MLSLTALVHGDSGTGKSWFGASGPGPRLVIDAEGRGLYLPTPDKVFWDPRTEIPLDRIGPDTTVIATVRNFAEFELSYQWLASGKHPFVSVTLDSVSELQQRCIDNVAGTGQMQTQDWGDVLREMDAIIRKMKDLRTHPTQPLQSLVVLAGSKERAGKQRAMVQGQLADWIPYRFDLVGYLTLNLDASGNEFRSMLIKPIGLYEAKDNTHKLSQHYGTHIVNPNICEMLAVLNQQEAA